MKIEIKKPLVFFSLSLVLIGFIGFVEKQDSQRTFQQIEVRVKGIEDVYFVDEKQVQKVIEKEFPILKAGISMKELSLDKIEKRVEQEGFVKNAEVYADLKGNVMVEITQFEPMARIVRPTAADAYISTDGIILPTSPSYTSRVITIEGSFAEGLLKQNEIAESHADLLELIRFIHEDEFWSAQITGLDIPKKDDIRLYQQVGRQVIEIGEAKDLEEKFDKISLFYEEILPAKGWNSYRRVNVEYKGQIVCE